MPMLINFTAFQVGWFSSVIGAAKQMPWLGPVVLVPVLAIHLKQSRRPQFEPSLIIACGSVGLFFDSLLVAFGWVAYPSGQFSMLLAPHWIVTMWMLFGTTLNSVLVDDDKIGYRRFELADLGDERRVRSEAKFDVRLLFVNAFRYRRENTEIWSDGCFR